MDEAPCATGVEGARTTHLAQHELGTWPVMVPAYFAAAVAWHWCYCDLENKEL